MKNQNTLSCYQFCYRETSGLIIDYLCFSLLVDHRPDCNHENAHRDSQTYLTYTLLQVQQICSSNKTEVDI